MSDKAIFRQLTSFRVADGPGVDGDKRVSLQ